MLGFTPSIQISQQPPKRVIMAFQPPNKLATQTALGDTPLGSREVLMIRLPFDMSMEESTNPSSWSTTLPRTPAHPCVLLDNSVLPEPMHELSVLVLRSFRGRQNCKTTLRSSSANFFLPLPFPSEESAPTPAAFGRPFSSPTYSSQLQTWLYVHPITFTVSASTKVIQTSAQRIQFQAKLLST